MNQSASKFAGIAGALVFGIGLVAIGKTSIGIAVLGVGLYGGLIMLPLEVYIKALVTAIGAITAGGLIAYQATTSEFTGKAIYWDLAHRGIRTELVTRQDFPSKFRVATNLRWGISIGLVLFSIGSFKFYRNCKSLDDLF